MGRITNHLPKETLAAFEYVDGVAHTADDKHNIMWHGRALKDAFIAGVKWQASQQAVEADCEKKCGVEATRLTCNGNFKNCPLDIVHSG